MTPQAEQMLLTVLTQLNSGIQKLALEEKRLSPHAEVLIGVAGVIPDKVKAFNIINLGLNGLEVTFADIPVTGITGITAIPAPLKVFGYSIENDQNTIVGPITVTPPANHHVVIQYLLQ